MNQNLILALKFAAGAGLYGLWAALVFTKLAPAQPLILAIGAGISAMLGYHAITNLQAAPKQVQTVLPTIPLGPTQ